MFYLEVKHEFDVDAQALCRGCLSIGRKLTPIDKLKDLTYTFLFQGLYETTSCFQTVPLCWECISRIKKVTQFQQQVRKANEIIQSGQNYVLGSLSTLSTVIIHDSHPNVVFINESNTKSVIHENNTDRNDESNSNESTSDFNDTIIDNEETSLENDVKVETTGKCGMKDKEISQTVENVQKVVEDKKKYKNKWAEKKALSNKTPKFKILTNNEIIIEKYCRRKKIDVEMVKTCMEKERDGDSFRKSDFKCESCVVTFKRKFDLKKHCVKYHREAIGEYICDICKCSTQCKNDLRLHIIRHTIIYECTLCGYSCRSIDDRKSHFRNHRQVYQCLKCELSFSSRKDFNKHHKDAHECFVCDHCGVSFKMKYCIENHIKKQHSKFECVPCKKQFARYSGLWLHNKLCHSKQDGAPASAYCVECDRRFVDVYRYKWHLYNSVKHTAKKKTKIPCPDCGKEFSKNIYMKDHYNLVHLKKFKYRCEQCDKNFVRNADLVKHKRRVHEGVQPPRNKMCYVCGRGFTTNVILTHHLRTHSGERPHACASCPARFAQRTALVAHQRALHRA